MKLMTPDIKQKLMEMPQGATKKQGKNAEVIVKYFNPCGIGTWLITEGRKQPDGDWLLYGYHCLYDWEWGYVSLTDLESIELPFGLRIERDLYASGTVAELSRWG